MYKSHQERRGSSSRGQRDAVGVAPRPHPGRRSRRGERENPRGPRSHGQRDGRLRERLLLHVLGHSDFRLAGLRVPRVPAPFNYDQFARQTRVGLMEGVSSAQPTSSAFEC